eukprot:m.5756 g.5756  ORF g.5756 m.5756 type:complete len:266 (+) comp14055_c0_seq1:44-841(+)
MEREGGSSGLEVLQEAPKNAETENVKDSTTKKKAHQNQDRLPYILPVRADRLKDLKRISDSLKKRHSPKEKLNGQFLPFIDTDLTPYVSTQVANYIIHQPDKIPTNGVYRQRATAQKIPDPEVDLSMSKSTPSPKPMLYASYPPTTKPKAKMEVTVTEEFFKGKSRKPLRLPKIPPLRITFPKLRSTSLNHGEVLSFRNSLKQLEDAHAQERSKEDFTRAKRDCKRFHLDKLLPHSRPVFGEALKAYMNTSTGSKRAAQVATKPL